MTKIAKEVVTVHFEDELKRSYLAYAMSVIVGRALPDVYDGLKPVHRRVLYAMHELNNDWNKPYKKSARVVGDVIGKYHPHGDTAIYDTIVRMAQTFSLRYPLVDGQGNFGSIDGDSPAAMRYTEVRMSKLAHMLLSDIEKETVDFELNYDETETIPTVLPTRIPNLLINGSSGIAVGMATNIPPHNINEVIHACVALIDTPEMTITDLMQYIEGPDFPTAGLIQGRAGIIQAYHTGQGHIRIRAKTHIICSDKTGKESIIVTEIPYQVNKSHLLEKIADLVKEKKVEGISTLRDESDKDGIRIVIEIRRGAMAEVILNNLFAHTQLQDTFGINMVALEDGQPKLMNLKQILEAFIYHRRCVVTRRTLFELKKARERAHTLEGLSIALANIDEIIALIKHSKTPIEAKEKLLAKPWSPGRILDMLDTAGKTVSQPQDLPEQYGLKPEGYWMSPHQAQAILDLKLHRLTGLEQEKITSEYEDLLKLIQNLLDILANTERLMQIIRQELIEMKEQFGDTRRTQIVEVEDEITAEDLIKREDRIVTLSHEGYIKTQPVDTYQAQRRGGKGKLATSMKEADFIEKLMVANTHDTILCFSDHGKVYWLKVYQLPQAARQARGKPLVNLLPLAEDERINTLLPVKTFSQDQFVLMATASGIVKKVALTHFSRPRSQGIIAISLDDDDRLIGVNITTGDQNILLFTNAGKAIRFSEKLIRATGRTARGVRGIRLKGDQRVIDIIVAQEQGTILTATENGYGKRTSLEEYRASGRGGQGIFSIRVNKRNGLAIGAIQVDDDDEMMLISNRGTLVRLRASDLSIISRNTQGVRLINLAENEKLIAIARVIETEEEDE